MLKMVGNCIHNLMRQFLKTMRKLNLIKICHVTQNARGYENQKNNFLTWKLLFMTLLDDYKTINEPVKTENEAIWVDFKDFIHVY